MIAVVFAAFAVSPIFFMKEIAVGMTVAVLIDATDRPRAARAVADAPARRAQLVGAEAAADGAPGASASARESLRLRLRLQPKAAPDRAVAARGWSSGEGVGVGDLGDLRVGERRGVALRVGDGEDLVLRAPGQEDGRSSVSMSCAPAACTGAELAEAMTLTVSRRMAALVMREDVGVRDAVVDRVLDQQAVGGGRRADRAVAQGLEEPAERGGVAGGGWEAVERRWWECVIGRLAGVEHQPGDAIAVAIGSPAMGFALRRHRLAGHGLRRRLFARPFAAKPAVAICE